MFKWWKFAYCAQWYAVIMLERTIMDRSITDIVLSPNSSSVVSLRKDDPQPPNKTTTLNLAPLPNTTADRPCRGTMRWGRVTCKNNGWRMRCTHGYSTAIVCTFTLSCISSMMYVLVRTCFCMPYGQMWHLMTSLHKGHVPYITNVMQDHIVADL